MSIVPDRSYGPGMDLVNYAYNYARPYFSRAPVVIRKKKRRPAFKPVPKEFKKNLLNLKDTKYVDSAGGSATPVAGTSIVTTINQIAQGDTDETRDGSDIYVMSYQFRALLNLPVAGITTNFIRCMLVQKYDTRGSPLTLAELYDSDSFFALRNLDNSKNFRILKSKMYKMAPMTTTSDLNKQFIQFYHKFKNPVRVKYDGTLADDASIDRNGLYIVWMCNEASGQAITVSGLTDRLAFKDI